MVVMINGDGSVQYSSGGGGCVMGMAVGVVGDACCEGVLG